jgi:hypothetical protein
MGTVEIRRLKQLEEESAKLKWLVADLSLDKTMLQRGCGTATAGCTCCSDVRAGRSTTNAPFGCMPRRVCQSAPSCPGASGLGATVRRDRAIEVPLQQRATPLSPGELDPSGLRQPSSTRPRTCLASGPELGQDQFPPGSLYRRTAFRGSGQWRSAPPHKSRPGVIQLLHRRVLPCSPPTDDRCSVVNRRIVSSWSAGALTALVNSPFHLKTCLFRILRTGRSSPNSHSTPG